VGVFEWFAAHERYNDGVYGAFGVEWLIPCAPGAQDSRENPCFTGPISPRTTEWYPTQHFWWFNDTRLIPDTIAETPFFSFLLGDLHPHVMSIPLVLLAIALAAAIHRGRRPLSWRAHRRNPFALAVLVVVFGGLAFMNAWDVLTFTGVLSLAVFFRNWRHVPEGGRPRLLTAGGATLGYIGPVAALGIVAYLPWYLEFSSQADGIHPYIGAGTRPTHAFLQFGALGLAAMVGATVALRGVKLADQLELILNAAWLPLGPILAWVAFALVGGDLNAGVDARTASGWVTLALYAAGTWLMTVSFLLMVKQRHPAALAMGLGALGGLLLIGGELFYIGDVFAGSVPRLNTVFKLGYQAWIVLAVAGGVSLVLALREAAQRGWAMGWLAAPAAAIALAGLVTPIIAIPNRTLAFGTATNANVTPTIDGLADLARFDPDEYGLARWVADNTDPGDVVVEATGRGWGRNAEGTLVLVQAGVDYTDSARISARTGRQTPIGWYFHEIQWRGDTEANRQEFSGRQDAVDRDIYLSQDPAAVLETLNRFNARYVVVGNVELARYPEDALTMFEEFLEVAFVSGPVRVYRVPAFAAEETS
jgi:YYY domain-containing protein